MPLRIEELTVDAIGAAYADGRLTAETLVVALLDRIQTFNPRYNALIFTNPDAVAQARAIDQRRAAGEALGPLAGIPVVVKDTMDMVGFPTTAGWSLLYGPMGGTDLLPESDSTVVARLRAAGAIILGKTNVPILSCSGTHADDSWAGPTFNAVDRRFVPGASSAGTATAVAGGMAVLGLAEETGGSIQNPAAAQDLVGIKPTLGLVSTAGVMPLAGLRDVVGPIARCVKDAALALDVLAGYCAADPKTLGAVGRTPLGGYTARLAPRALQHKRIGTYGPGWRDQPLSEEAGTLYARAQRELAAQGAVLVQDPFAGSGFAALRRATAANVATDERGLESLPYDLQRYLQRLGPHAALRSFHDFVQATAQDDVFGADGLLGYARHLPGFEASFADPQRPPEQAEFIAVKAAYLQIFDRVFDQFRLDAMVFPQMRDELPRMFSGQPIAETTVSEINIAGLPGVTLPAGYYASGAPFGLIFVGRQWSEADLLAYAYAYETATHHRRAPALE